MKKRKLFNIFQVFIIVCFCIVYLTSCDSDITTITSEDGFVYYVLPTSSGDNGKRRATLIELPEREVVEIPAAIDGIEVTQLGYSNSGIGWSRQYPLSIKGVKKIIISNDLNIYRIDGYDAVLESIVIDNWFIGFGELPSFDYFRDIYREFHWANPEISFELIRTSSDQELEEYEANRKFDIIYLPTFVTHIDSNLFDYFEGTIFVPFAKTEVPAGWKDGWFGSAKVEWDFNEFLYIFDLNGGSNLIIFGEPTNYLIFPREELIPKPNDPIRDGYTFLGWSEKKPDSIGSVDYYDFFRINNTKQATVLYAYWSVQLK